MLADEPVNVKSRQGTKRESIICCIADPGCACAAELTLKGFDVFLCSAYASSHIKPILEKGGLQYSGKLGEGFVNLKATTNLEEAATDADIIIIVTPSYIHEKYARLLVPILNKRRKNST